MVSQGSLIFPSSFLFLIPLSFFDLPSSESSLEELLRDLRLRDFLSLSSSLLEEDSEESLLEFLSLREIMEDLPDFVRLRFLADDFLDFSSSSLSLLESLARRLLFCSALGLGFLLASFSFNSVSGLAAGGGTSSALRFSRLCSSSLRILLSSSLTLSSSFLLFLSSTSFSSLTITVLSSLFFRGLSSLFFRSEARLFFRVILRSLTPPLASSLSPSLSTTRLS